MSAKTPEDLNSQEEIPPIPKRPLTAYNIFSVLERHYILQQSECAPAKSAGDDKDVVDQTLDPHYARRPPRYKNVTLPANWYVVSQNKRKRADHKCHGLVGFVQLSKMMSDAWAQADEYTKEYCKSIYQSELVGHRAEQQAFKEKYGEEAFKKQTCKRKNADAAKRGEAKKSDRLRMYEEAYLKELRKNGEKVEEKEDGKAPAVEEKPAVAAAVVGAPRTSLSKLSKMMSDVWAQADEHTKSYCKSIYQSELVGYRAEQQAFKEKYGEEAFEQTRKRKNTEAAEGGDAKKSMSLRKYEEVYLKVLEENEEKFEEKEDGKVPAVEDKPAVAAAVAAAPQAGRIPAPLNLLERLLQERQVIAERLYQLTYGSATATQNNDGLGQVVCSTNHERKRKITQETVNQRALREEAIKRSPPGIASMHLLDTRFAMDPRLAVMQMEQMRREENIARAVARTRAPAAAAVPKNTQASSTSISEDNRIEELSLQLGSAAQRERLGHIIRPGNRPEKAVFQETTRQPPLSDTDRLACNAGNSTEATAMMPQQGPSLLGEGGIVAQKISPQQQQMQQKDQIALLMSLKGLAGKSLSVQRAALSNPVVLDCIENLQRLQQRRLQLQEQLLLEMLGLAE